MTKNAITVTLVLILAAACGGGESSYFAVDAEYQLIIDVRLDSATDPCLSPGMNVIVDQEAFLRKHPPDTHPPLDLIVRDPDIYGGAWEAEDDFRNEGEPAPGVRVTQSDGSYDFYYETLGAPRDDLYWDAEVLVADVEEFDCEQEGTGTLELRPL